MCGINGIISDSYPENGFLRRTIHQMNDEILHRGPDSDGIYIDKNLAFGFRRLAIIDLSPRGDQPMISQSGRFVIVFNGEIYNFNKLRDFLKKEYSVSFLGTSDTEVFLTLIEREGLTKALSRVQGMFAFALFDKKNNSIHLCRDRVGEKPLYFYSEHGSLYFSSELRPLMKPLKKKLTLNKEAINFFIRKSYFPEWGSVFKEVKKVTPGTVQNFKFNQGLIVSSKVTSYWDFEKEVDESISNIQSDYLESKNYLNNLLEEKVKERMISDVPLGAFLSGGYDSSLIVALMQKNQTKKIKTFSIGFDSPDYDEAVFSKKVADHLGTEHTELYINDRDLLETIYKIPQIYSEPFADPSQIPTILLSQLTKSKVTVSLSGDGGDEIFGGYSRYFLGQRIVNSLGKIPFTLRHFIKVLNILDNSLTKNFFFFFLKNRLTGLQGKYDKLINIFDFQDEKDLYARLSTFQNSFLINDSNEKLYKESIWSKNITYAEKAMMQDTIDYLPGDILRKVDLASMSVSLETRIPFLDHEIISYAWTLPFDFKYRKGSGKFILKDIAHDYISSDLLDRPKKGFDIPLNSYLRNELREYSTSMIDKSKKNLEELFNFEEIDKVYNSHLVGDADYSNLLWNTITFFAWYEEYLTSS